MPATLKTLIVDDEPIARRILREELEALEDVRVIGEADNGATALDLIGEHNPDLVLLDLQMPLVGGLEVVRRLKCGARLPAIVMVTAWDQYAIQAFEVGAIDYLLKPVAPERLAEAVERVRQRSASMSAEQIVRIQELHKPSNEPAPRRIIGRLGTEYVLLNADEVYAFQADGDLVWIMTAKGKLLASQTLAVLEERLRDSSFQRIHRNALVNINHVRKMSALSSQRWLVTLNNRIELTVSKRQARTIQHLLDW